jgi:hypothetical protein
MTFKPEISLGDLIAAASFLVAALALFLTLYQLRRDAARKRAEFRVTALIAQLNVLTQIQAMPDDRRREAWEKIASASGGPGAASPIEKAIATQMQFLDQIAQSKEVPIIPTYERKPNRIDA